MKILEEFFEYYHNDRPHQSLEKKSPIPRKIELTANDMVFAVPRVEGLHHLYTRAA